ncbi:MAG TPA: hypothetical protein VF349_07750 [Candidatus Limnocylindrales bacterium]
MLLCLIVYFISQPNRTNPYLHFVLQAQSWLDGQTSIPTPGYQDVMPILDPAGQDTGRGIIPFPPLPAWVLLPFVAVWHVSTNEQLLATIFAAIDVGIAYWMLGQLPVRPAIRLSTSVFLGLGSVLWYAAAIGTTWFWAHIVALGCLLLSVGLALSVDRDAAEPRPMVDAIPAVRKLTWPGGWSSVALLGALGVSGELLVVLAGAGTPVGWLALLGVAMGALAAALALAVAGRRGVVAPFAVSVVVVAGMPALFIAGTQSATLIEVVDVLLAVAIIGLWWLSRRNGAAVDRALASFWTAVSAPEAVQVAAGIFFGLAVTARLTILLGFPFLILVGGGGTWLRRGMLAGAGAAVPLLTLLVVTYATSGHLFNPAYDYLYHLELGYPFGYNADWSITDFRYIPQNFGIMFFNQPWWMASADANGRALCTAGAARGLFDPACPLAIPNPIGMSLILTSPAYLMAPFAWLPTRLRKLDRATVGATIAVVGIAVVNLMHFSQGWVQFGYRFSNDFAPFALILVALGASRIGRLRLFLLLVAVSVAINFWGVTWGTTLGW